MAFGLICFVNKAILAISSKVRAKFTASVADFPDHTKGPCSLTKQALFAINQACF